MMGFFKKPSVRTAFAVLTAVMIYFIFFMSSFNAEDSSEMSGGVLEIINSFFAIFGAPELLTEHIVRKAAHFTEFIVLGGLLYFDGLGFTEDRVKRKLFPVCTGALAAFADEMSQFFSPGRSPMAGDVIIDVFGVIWAVIVLEIIFWHIIKVK